METVSETDWWKHNDHLTYKAMVNMIHCAVLS